jgi:hypothetical protein
VPPWTKSIVDARCITSIIEHRMNENMNAKQTETRTPVSKFRRTQLIHGYDDCTKKTHKNLKRIYYFIALVV